MSEVAMIREWALTLVVAIALRVMMVYMPVADVTAAFLGILLVRSLRKRGPTP